MTLADPQLSACRFCSEVSRSQGEDPIGSAEPSDHWLISEIPLPWPRRMFAEDPRLKPVFALLSTAIVDHGVKIKPLAIAPDPEYSISGRVRFLYYRRPRDLFAQFEKYEYLLPESEAVQLSLDLIKYLIGQPNDLPRFEQYLQEPVPTRDILVCTHGEIDAACARFGKPLYMKLRRELADQSDQPLRVWRVTHFGGHQFAPTLIDMPEGRYWGHLDPEILTSLLFRHGPVETLKPFLRGWSGLGRFEQMVEREIWMKEGWDWLRFHRSGQVLAKHMAGLKQFYLPLLKQFPSKRLRFLLEIKNKEAQWVKIRINYWDPQTDRAGAYEGKVEAKGEVITAHRSGENMQLESVPQYQVTQLTQLDR